MLRAYLLTYPKTGRGSSTLTPPIHYIVAALIGIAGSARPCDLTSNDIRKAAASYDRLATTTRYSRAGVLRRVCRYLHAEHGAPDLSQAVPRVIAPAPRNVTATDEERRKVIESAPPFLKCWLLLCSDLAMRSGTAARVCPAQYDRKAGTLTFRTKYEEALTMQVTDELRSLFGELTGRVPFVSQLHPQGGITAFGLRTAFLRLKERVGVRRAVRPHDLRRTTAAKVYDMTSDLRIVQALLGHRSLQTTLHYLDHRNTPVPRNLLELVKLNGGEAAETPAQFHNGTETIQ